MVLRLAMSPGSNKACSTAFATYPTFPCWESLIKASIGRGDPYNIRDSEGDSKLEPWHDIHTPSPQWILQWRTSFEQSWPFWPPSRARLLWYEGPFLLLPLPILFYPTSSSCLRGQVEKLGKVKEWGAWFGSPLQVRCLLHGTSRDPRGLSWFYAGAPLHQVHLGLPKYC